MRVFMSTGEPSGDMLAAALAEAMRAREPAIRFEGIGSERMAQAGFRLRVRTSGWASIGLMAALVRIVPLLLIFLIQVVRLRLHPVDLIVLVDFGALNLRLTRSLRRLGYRGPILYYVPPGAWFDDAAQARTVAGTSTALTSLARQRDFYRSLGLPIAYFGHPLLSLVSPRPARPPAAEDGGTVALLPGSRYGEVGRHMPRLIAAAERLYSRRPNLGLIVSAADAGCERLVRDALRGSGISARVVRGSRAALDAADAAIVASGTAVLEAMLREVPCVALYVVSARTERYFRRRWNRKYITLPNLLLDRSVVPEFVQEETTPERLAAALERQLSDPSEQRAAARELRAILGPPNGLERAAEFALALARGESPAVE
jgi:lipid-A-disaccharide synthase